MIEKEDENVIPLDQQYYDVETRDSRNGKIESKNDSSSKDSSKK